MTSSAAEPGRSPYACWSAELSVLGRGAGRPHGPSVSPTARGAGRDRSVRVVGARGSHLRPGDRGTLLALDRSRGRAGQSAVSDHRPRRHDRAVLELPRRGRTPPRHLRGRLPSPRAGADSSSGATPTQDSTQDADPFAGRTDLRSLGNRTYRWPRILDAHEWTAMLATFSDHARLPEHRLRETPAGAAIGYRTRRRCGPGPVRDLCLDGAETRRPCRRAVRSPSACAHVPQLPRSAGPSGGRHPAADLTPFVREVARRSSSRSE